MDSELKKLGVMGVDSGAVRRGVPVKNFYEQDL